MNDAERERLTMLAEEAAEVVQAVTKILRHGYDSYYPGDPKRSTNQELLQEELTDLLAIVDRMNLVNDIDIALNNNELFEERWAKKLKWTHHQNG